MSLHKFFEGRMTGRYVGFLDSAKVIGETKFVKKCYLQFNLAQDIRQVFARYEMVEEGLTEEKVLAVNK